MNASVEPKRRNAARTRAKILAAAQQSFAELGYSQAGIRDVAAAADVSSALLLRYFGSKAGLFEAALIDAMHVEGLFGGARQAFGEQLARLFLDVGRDIKPPSIVALALGDAQARDIATQVTAEHVLEPLARWLGPPDARVRALEIILLAMGFVLYTRQFPLLAGDRNRGAEKKLARWFASTVQTIVDRS
jgi:AcrR family transcriptional regulator